MNNILLRGLLLLIQLVNEVVLYKNENEEDSFDSYYQHIFLLFSPEQTRIKISLTRVERTYGVFYFIDSINRRCMHAYLVM